MVDLHCHVTAMAHPCCSPYDLPEDIRHRDGISDCHSGSHKRKNFQGMVELVTLESRRSVTTDSHLATLKICAQGDREILNKVENHLETCD